MCISTSPESPHHSLLTIAGQQHTYLGSQQSRASHTSQVLHVQHRPRATPYPHSTHLPVWQQVDLRPPAIILVLAQNAAITTEYLQAQSTLGTLSGHSSKSQRCLSRHTECSQAQDEHAAQDGHRHKMSTQHKMNTQHKINTGTR